MPKKSPLDVTVEELDRIGREAFAAEAADLASGKITIGAEDFGGGMPSRVLEMVMEELQSEDCALPSANESKGTSASQTSEETNSWDEFFSELENTEDFLLDRDQGEI